MSQTPGEIPADSRKKTRLTDKGPEFIGLQIYENTDTKASDCRSPMAHPPVLPKSPLAWGNPHAAGL